MNKNIAVVILNWNGEKFLREFLPSVLAYSDGARVVVADNGSTDSSVAVLQSEFAAVEVVELGENYGFAEGYNRAFDILRERYDGAIKYYVLLNSDIEVSEGWLAPALEIFEREENTAAIQPKIKSYHDKTQFEYAGASGGFMDSIGYPFCRGRLIANCESDEGQYDTEREIFWASGAALFVRSEVYHRVGGLDALFFAHMEEIDMCWRIKRLGYSIKVAPRSVVYHVGAGTLPVWSPRKTYLNFRNNIAMLYKNLTLGRFMAVYFVRFFTDSLRFATYFFTGQFSFAGAVFRGHRDFWRTRRKYRKDKSIAKGRVGQIYKGSIVLYYIFKSKKFKNLL